MNLERIREAELVDESGHEFGVGLKGDEGRTVGSGGNAGVGIGFGRGHGDDGGVSVGLFVRSLDADARCIFNRFTISS